MDITQLYQGNIEKQASAYSKGYITIRYLWLQRYLIT